MGFDLLQEDTLYRRVITSSTGHYEHGLWVKGVEVVTYPSFQAEYEPFEKSQNSMILPSGVYSKDSIIIYSNLTDLKTANDLSERQSLPDIIYLEDPTSDASLVDAYEITDKQFWKKNRGFSLLDNDYGYYLAVRKGKGE